MTTAVLTPNVLDSLKGETLESVDRVLLAAKFRDFIPAAWTQYLPAVPYVPGWHIDAMAEHLQAVSDGQIRRLIMSIAPRHTKSSIAGVLFPAWHWTRRASTRFLTGAYSEDVSLRDAVHSRTLMDTPWYRRRWGCLCGGAHAPGCVGWGFASDQNVKSRYANDRGGERLTASVKAGTTGEGGDILYMDDPIDIIAAQSDASRQHAWHYVSRVWFGRMNDAKKSAMIFAAQRTNQDDVTGRLLAEGGFEHLCIPTEYNPKVFIPATSIGFTDKRTVPGELLWPARFGPDEVARAKKDLYAWSAQHQQQPTPEAGGFIKRAWFRFWHRDHVSVVRDDKGNEYVSKEIPDRFDQIIQSWDCSKLHDADNIRKKSDSDPVSGQVWGRVGPDYYLLDRVNERMDVVETCGAIVEMTKKWPQATAKLIEYAANGPSVINFLKRHISGLIPATPEGSKVARVMTAGRTDKQRDSRAVSMVALFNGGNVYIPHPLEHFWSWEFLEQLVGFPTAPHDDDVDAASQALSYLQPKTWQEQDKAERLQRTEGPPAKDTWDVFRRENKKALEQEQRADGGRAAGYRRAR